MEKTNEEMTSTGYYKFGKWTCNVANANVTINITKETVTILGKIGQEAIDANFANETWWLGEYLCFTSDQRFYIHYANEKTLAFGELLDPCVVGEIKWGLVLTRAQ